MSLVVSGFGPKSVPLLKITLFRCSRAVFRDETPVNVSSAFGLSWWNTGHGSSIVGHLLVTLNCLNARKTFQNLR